jgi:hypothetical protein
MKLASIDRVLSSRYLPWLTAAGWLVAGITSLILDKPAHALDAWMLAPLTLTYLVLSHFAIARWPVLPKYGRVGFGVLLLSAPSMAVGQLAALFDWDALKFLGFPVAVLAWMLGSALFGIALAKSGFEPRWAGYAIGIAQLSAIITGVALSPIRELSDYGSYTGALAHGVIWLSIAWSLNRNAEASIDQPQSYGVALESPGH